MTTMTGAVSGPARRTDLTADDTVETLTETVQWAESAAAVSVLVELDHEVTTPARLEMLRVGLIATFDLADDTWVAGVQRRARHEVPWGDLRHLGVIR